MLESGRHVICEKPLATSSEETAALRALAESRPAQAAAVNYNVRYYPALPRDPRADRRGATGARAQRHRVVRPGLAALPRRLQLARRAGRPDEPPRRRRHRHALDGPGPVPGRHADPRGQRRPGHVPPPAAQAHRADRHLHRLGGSAGSRPARGGGDHDRRPCRGPPAVRRGRPGCLPRLAGHRRPQEPPDDRDRRHRGLGLPGTASRPTGSGSARARGPTRSWSATRPARPGRRRDQPTIPAGTPRASPTRSSSSTSTSTAGSSQGRAAGRPPSSRPSPTATAKSGSARRSPAAPPTADGPKSRSV